MPGTAEGADVALLGLFQHRNDVRVLVQMPDVGHTQNGAEALRHLQLLRGGQVLVAEEQHGVVRQRLMDKLHGRSGRVGKVKPNHFSPAGGRKRLDLHQATSGSDTMASASISTR